MTSPLTQPIGWPQNRLRHDVGAGGRHDGANRTYSNAYEAYTTRSLVQNLRHALGRRIEVNIYHVILMFFFSFFSFSFIFVTLDTGSILSCMCHYILPPPPPHLLCFHGKFLFSICVQFVFNVYFWREISNQSPSIGPTKQSLRYHIGTIG